VFAVAKVSEAVESERNVLFANASFAEILALSKLGIAIAAKRAMIATTIIISTSVNPLRLNFIFMIFLPFFDKGRHRFS
jgi:hypothetical protein